MAETGYTIKQLAEAGIEIFEYVHGKSLTPRRAIDKILSNVQGFADEAHREATSERVHEAHTRLHEAGHVGAVASSAVTIALSTRVRTETAILSAPTSNARSTRRKLLLSGASSGSMTPAMG